MSRVKRPSERTSETTPRTMWLSTESDRPSAVRTTSHSMYEPSETSNDEGASMDSLS